MDLNLAMPAIWQWRKLAQHSKPIVLLLAQLAGKRLQLGEDDVAMAHKNEVREPVAVALNRR